MRLTSTGGLDSQSQFLLDEVAKEDRIDILIRSFGLPQRVMEDALAELLARNRASLDVARGRILKSSDRPERRQYRLSPPFDVWQDEYTGSILPFSMVHGYTRYPKTEHAIPTLRVRGQAEVRDLLDLPAARSLGALLSADPTLKPDKLGWVADGLVDAEKIAAADLYLPLETVDIDGRVIEYVAGKGLPSWLTRSWSFELATSDTASDASEDSVRETDASRSQVENAMLISTVQPSSSIFERSTLEYILTTWRRNFDGALRSCYELVRQKNGFVLEQLKSRVEAYSADLAQQVTDSGHILLGRTSRSSHLKEMWDCAQTYLVVLRHGFTVGDLEAIWSQTEAGARRGVHLLLIDSSGRLSRDVEAWLGAGVEREAGGEVVLAPTERPLDAEMCVTDAPEARIGAFQSLMSDDQVLIVQGSAVVRQFASLISSELSSERGGWWVS